MTYDSGELARHVGRRVRELREERDTSLSALARSAQLSKATLSELERGTANPTLATLEALAVTLGVTVWDLLQTDPG